MAEPVDEPLSQGVAGLDDFVGREPPFEAGKPRADPVHVSGEQSVGDARKPILLLDDRGNAGLGRRPEERTACETAHADGHVRSEPADDAAAHPEGAEQPEGKEQVACGQSPVKAGDGQTGDGVAGGRHAVHFHAAPGADEFDDRVRFPSLQGFGDGQGRVDVPAGSAAGDEDAEGAVRHGRGGPVGGRGCARGGDRDSRWVRRPPGRSGNGSRTGSCRGRCR